jgi:hypothetical protein
MKNKLDETDTIGGKIYWIVPESQDEFSEDQFPNERDYDLGNIPWKDPAASRELVKELLGVVNSEAEYDLLLKQLAELDSICASRSLQLKGGAAKQF